jgi:hypothetical protein
MREDLPNKYLTCSVLDHHDEAILVPFDIEDGTPAYGIGMTIGLTNIMETLPSGFLGDAVPSIKWLLKIRMLLRGILELLSAYDMHR